MASPINSIAPAIKAATQLNQANKALSGSYERLSTGLRINHGVDDPGGLQIAARAELDAAVFKQGSKNIADGSTYIGIAGDAVKELRGLVESMYELAVKATSTGTSGAAKLSLNEQLEDLRTEYNRVVDGTQYQYADIFTSSNTSLTIQDGYGSSGEITTAFTAQHADYVGSGTLGSSTTLATGGAAIGSAVLAVDVNGDGVSDIVSTQSGTLSVRISNGDGTFGTAATYSTGADNVTTLAAGDFNGDGNVDIFTNGSNQIGVLLGTGNGGFAARQTLALSGPSQLATADFNSDGYADLVVASRTDNAVYVYEGNGGGSFGTPQVAAAAGTSPSGVGATDLNGDGKLDLVIVALQSNTLKTFLQNSTGGFDPYTSTSASGVAAVPSAFVNIADVNNDSIADVVYTVTNNANAFVQLGSGNGNFGAATGYSMGGANSRSSAVADLNGDGFKDIVGVSSSSQVAVLLNQGNGTFAAAATYSIGAGGGVANTVSAGDFNNDGITDVVAGNNNDFTLRTLQGNAQYLSQTLRVQDLTAYDITTEANAYEAKRSLSVTRDHLSILGGLFQAGESRLGYAQDFSTQYSINQADAAQTEKGVDVGTEVQDLVANQLHQHTAQVSLQGTQQQAEIANKIVDTSLKISTKA